MSTSSSQSRVTITLNLTGQNATVKGIQSVDAALSGLADTAESVQARVGAAMDSSSAAIAAANKRVAASSEETSAQLKATSDAAAAAGAKAAGATEETAARVNAATSTASSGILGLLTSFKSLSVGAATYLGVRSYTSYTSSLTKLTTLAGLTQKQVASLNQEIMGTAVALRQSPAALAQAAYSPASERFGLAGTEQVIKYAAQLSNLGGGPISGSGSTSYAISTMLQTLGLSPSPANVAKVAAMIRGTTSAGDMQLPDLVGALSTGILTTGKTYGINPEATLGALAYFTSQGVPAQEAATRMRMTESLLVGQTAQAAKYGQALGITPAELTGEQSALSTQLFGLGLRPTQLADMVRQGPGGLAAAFNLLNRSMASLPQDQREALFAKLFGGGRTDATAMALAQGAMSGQLMNFTDAVAGSSTVGGLSQATSQFNNSPQGKLKAFQAQLEVFATQLGSVVMPVLQQLMNVLGPLLSLFAKHKVLLDALALLVGGELAIKLFGFIKNLKTIQSVGHAINDIKWFTGISSDAKTAETAVGKLIQKLLEARGIHVGGAAAGDAAGAGGALGGIGVVGGGIAGIGAITGYGLYMGINPEGTISDGAARASGFGMYSGAGYHGPAGGYNFNPKLGGMGLNGLNLSGLQGINFSGIPGYASGGVTSGPMAIVGEGSKRFPEYVIPTDPTYRNRALQLFMSLGGHLLGGGMDFLIAAGGLAGGHGGLSAGGGGGGGSNQQIGQRLAAAMGWTGVEWSDLNKLWQRESGWNNLARNASSGAYGIPQALPATKLPFAGQASGGSDPAAQIRWGLQYIRGRYGDPAGAWAHEQNFGWYAKGGVLPFASYDTGGYLPEGFSIAHNGTGAPEPVGAAIGAGSGDLHVHVEIDSREVGCATVKHFRDKAARR